MKHVSFTLPSISASVSCMDLMNLQSQTEECEKAGIFFFIMMLSMEDSINASSSEILSWRLSLSQQIFQSKFI